MIIVTALVALVQITAARTGSASPLTTAVSTATLGFEEALSALVTSTRAGGQALIDLPSLQRENAALHEHNLALTAANERLRQEVASYRAQLAIEPRMREYPRGIEARVIGYPPENAVQSVTIDKGSRAGVARDDGVLAAHGVVGRVVSVTPFTSEVALLTDFTSTIPAIVARGHYWGIARGNLSSVRLDYVSEDAPLHPGERVVTGEARSFHAGALIGTIVAIDRSDASLYQTAVLKPAVNFSRLDRVVVLPQ